MRTAEGTNGQGLSVHIEEVGAAWIEAIDPRVADRIRTALEEGARRVTLTLSSDTQAHAWDRGIASVDMRLDDDDVEGHAIAVRFPSPDDARRFQARMLATGALVATIAVGGVGLASQGSFGIGTEGTTQQAPVAQAAPDLAGTTSAGEQYQNVYAPRAGDLAGSTSASQQYADAYASGDDSTSIPGQGVDYPAHGGLAGPSTLAGSTSASQQYADAYASGDDSTSDLAGTTTAGEQYQNTYAGGDSSSTGDAGGSQDAGRRTPGHQPR